MQMEKLSSSPQSVKSISQKSGLQQDTPAPPSLTHRSLLVADLKKRDIVDVAISDMRLRKYDHGMAQPAVFVIRQDGTVLYRWAIVPSLMNLGGAKDRPLLEEIWHNVDASLHGKEAVHTTYSTAGVAAVIREKLRSR
ncbi:uncharacterized protein B0I36DRAFT_356422 [Microdochium trichocladiopsis]|uniref:Alkyl hydroperoxide reductase subunit C/ Thiol specific antioxidant domain-containing protein n=1 Tax=Microdochium trichocladiopsis TaxID=1682393 RepID=A0A9P8XQ66_9PEZI|nr:uncharacterized protein B0I36DRAFT_356422 [Microdochium trichocladiopsis]KAH7010809.1 hypothetical protein B0I36DRAFT_356422 [Microdochium trichocladiopsis]